MSWQDRQYDESGGGVRSALRRIFGDGENPLTWSLPLYRLWGIAVRIHIFYVVFIVARLISSILQTNIGPGFMLMGMAMLFILVLLHEYGHCIACRHVEGEADRIIMWPLGGLAFCLPPHDWKSHIITALGGPAVNVILLPVFALGVFVATGDLATVFFNPFAPSGTLSLVILRDGSQPLWLGALWWAHYMNIVLLGFNMLVPMYPMDAGRVVHALLWRSSSYNAAMKTTTTIGLVAAGVMAVVGLAFNVVLLIVIAAFGGITCWMEKRRIAFEGAGEFGYDFSRGYQGLPDEETPKREGRAARRRAQQAAKDQAELDRLLAKIAKEGMGKLTRREKRFLERESTKRKSG